MVHTNIAGIRKLNVASNYSEFSLAVSHITSSFLNIVYTNDKDNIGYMLSGALPIRPQYVPLVIIIVLVTYSRNNHLIIYVLQEYLVGKYVYINIYVYLGVSGKMLMRFSGALNFVMPVPGWDKQYDWNNGVV